MQSKIQLWSLFGILIFALLVPWVRFGFEYPSVLVQELDHCPELACDFSRHYLTQARHWLSGSTEMDSGWFYPPLLMLLIAPLTQVSNPAVWWTILNLIGVVGIVYCVAQQINGRWPFLLSTLLCASSLPVLHALKWGQISIMLTLCILIYITGKSSKIGSFFLGVAGAIKLYPLMFVLINLVARRLNLVWIPILIAVMIGVLFPWICLDNQVWSYWEAVIRGQQMVRNMASISGGQALSPTLHRWFLSGEHIGGQWNPDPVLLYGPWIKNSLLWLVLTLGLYDIVKMRSRPYSRVYAVYLLLWIHLLLQPGWVHYFCFVPFVQAVLWQKTNSAGRWGIVLTILIERIPLVVLSNHMYFGYVRSGGLTVVVLIMWWITRRSLPLQTRFVEVQ